LRRFNGSYLTIAPKSRRDAFVRYEPRIVLSTAGQLSFLFASTTVPSIYGKSVDEDGCKGEGENVMGRAGYGRFAWQFEVEKK